MAISPTTSASTPSGWSKRAISEFCTRSRHINVDGTDLPPLSVTKGRGVVLQSEKYNKRIATDPRKYVVARAGQFAFDPMSLYYGALGRVCVEAGLISPDYVAFDADDSVDAEFLNYFLRAPQQVQAYERVAETGNQFGKRRRVYWSVFEQLQLLLPPIEEQRKIAAILSSMDRAIEKVAGVIEQLQVVKKAMMQELLTRGLPGRHTRFKQTEIGEVPAEWAVRSLVDVAQVQTGIAKGKVTNGTTIAMPYLRVANVQDGYLDLGELKTIEVEPTQVERYSLRPGDVLFTEGGDADKLGRGCVWSGDIDPCLHQNHVFAVRADRERLLPQFLSLFGGSPAGKAYFLDAAKQTTNLASINSTQLKALPVPLPSMDEQRSIVAAVGATSSRIERERAYADALRAGKAAVMSVLLTGELRVTPDEDAA